MNTEEQLLYEAEERRKLKASAMDRPFSATPDFAARLEEIKTITPARERPPQPVDNSEKIAELLRKADLPERHANKTIGRVGAWGECFSKVKAKLGTGFVVALIGIRGTGKTQMAVELIKENAKQLRPSKFTSAMEIFLTVRASYRKDANTDELTVLQGFCRPNLLVIDEVQERAETPFEDRILTDLLNRRYNAEKDTILIGNLTREKFEDSMGTSVVSRLNETGGILTCEWQSFR